MLRTTTSRSLAALSAAAIVAATLAGCSPADPSIPKAEEAVTELMQDLATGDGSALDALEGIDSGRSLAKAAERITDVRVGDVDGFSTIYDETTGTAQVWAGYSLAGEKSVLEFEVSTGPSEAPATVESIGNGPLAKTPHVVGVSEESSYAQLSGERVEYLYPGVYEIEAPEFQIFDDGAATKQLVVNKDAGETMHLGVDYAAIEAAVGEFSEEVVAERDAHIQRCVETGHSDECVGLAPEDYLVERAAYPGSWSIKPELEALTLTGEPELVGTSSGLDPEWGGYVCHLYDVRATYIERGLFDIREDVEPITLRVAIDAYVQSGELRVMASDPTYCLPEDLG